MTQISIVQSWCVSYAHKMIFYSFVMAEIVGGSCFRSFWGCIDKRFSLRSFHIFIAPDHSHFAISTFRASQNHSAKHSRVLIDKSISKSDSNSTLAERWLAVNLSTIGQWHKVNICRDSRIMPTPPCLASRPSDERRQRANIEGKVILTRIWLSTR